MIFNLIIIKNHLVYLPIFSLSLFLNQMTKFIVSIKKFGFIKAIWSEDTIFQFLLGKFVFFSKVWIYLFKLYSFVNTSNVRTEYSSNKSKVTLLRFLIKKP